MDKIYAIAMIAVIALVTAALRFLPFFIFRGNRQTPKYVEYLGKVLPYAIMGMLVVYCLKGISFTALENWVPYLVASAAVVLIHLWKRNTLLSIITGTVLYMVLVQLIF